jgi:hypothetical protein
MLLGWAPPSWTPASRRPACGGELPPSTDAPYPPVGRAGRPEARNCCASLPRSAHRVGFARLKGGDLGMVLEAKEPAAGGRFQIAGARARGDVSGCGCLIGICSTGRTPMLRSGTRLVLIAPRRAPDHNREKGSIMAVHVKPHLIPIAKVDRAVRRIERWGSAEDRQALHEAVKLFPDRQASRQAIVDIALKVKVRR